ncbi:hypothetical protein [Nocardioides solisilvae]|uniref:hypothetical protein n=1 Tax=Nocardioides solisilvae TaxID=1542435 RepID=UPI000D742F15|nr:hypothetical protein [Nocardioides solisilvae]
MSAPIRPRLRVATGAAVACLALLGLAACGDDAESDTTTGGTTGSQDSSPDGGQPTDEAAPEAEPIRVTIEGDSIDPAGERVEVAAGEPVLVEVTADRAGELHVHSTPEQEIAFTEGTTEHELVIDQPGVVEVESHDPDLVVLQLEVR